MALGPMKTEMTGTGGGRWCLRIDAKNVSKKLRRRGDSDAVAEGLADFDAQNDEYWEEYETSQPDDDWYDDDWAMCPCCGGEDSWTPEQEAVTQVFNSLLDAAGADRGIL